MSYPDDYPEQYKESIFAWSHPGDSGAGKLTFVLTRGGGKLNVYVFQHLGHVDPDKSPDGKGGDVYLPCDGGSINDTKYNPDAEDSFLPEDMMWDGERPRLSQPVRNWLRSRDMLVASRDVLLGMVASEKNFELHSGWKE